MSHKNTMETLMSTTEYRRPVKAHNTNNHSESNISSRAGLTRLTGVCSIPFNDAVYRDRRHQNLRAQHQWWTSCVEICLDLYTSDIHTNYPKANANGVNLFAWSVLDRPDLPSYTRQYTIIVVDARVRQCLHSLNLVKDRWSGITLKVKADGQWYIARLW